MPPFVEHNPDLARRRLLLATPAWLALAGCGRRESAPAFEYTLLDGRQARSSELRGRVVLVNFWATSCVTCVAEMPGIVALHERFKARGFEALAVAMSYDPPALVSNYAQSRRLPFGVVIDNTGSFAKGFDQVQVTPTTVLINRHGDIVRRFVGEPDFAALNALVEKLLVES